MASGGFSQISIAEPGRIAFLSGQIAATPGSEDAPKDVAGQAKLATASLAAALEELKASARDIVMMRVYVVNAITEAVQQVLAALRDLLGGAKPSMTTIGEMAVRLP
ncbi:RidA family protein [Paraburkholderia strydomiana]|uniref:RidA family protein n=1 Tax=Paraburkholderia strydomiana TaxID=1245417 RepID=UPI0038BBD1FA